MVLDDTALSPSSWIAGKSITRVCQVFVRVTQDHPTSLVLMGPNTPIHGGLYQSVRPPSGHTRPTSRLLSVRSRTVTVIKTLHDEEPLPFRL